MNDDADRLARLAAGWDEAAEGYHAYFVPRFAPWVTAAVEAIAADTLPEGPVLVPCCGTFPELDTLLSHLPGRDIVGVDLSAGMVRVARERAAGHPNVSVVQGDASTLAPRWSGRCAAVVSVFGLQQLSDPHAAIRSWANALRPSGRLSVVFWPDITERDGPFARIEEVVRAHVPPGDASWENGLATALAAQGAVVERDETLAYSITHPHARAFFDAYSRFGPLRAHGLARGEAFIDTLRRQFLRDAPPGEWSHRPHGRIIVACRIGRELRGRDGKW